MHKKKTIIILKTDAHTHISSIMHLLYIIYLIHIYNNNKTKNRCTYPYHMRDAFIADNISHKYIIVMLSIGTGNIILYGIRYVHLL